MKKYDSYIDSNVEWIQKIPLEWKEKKLKNLFNESTKQNWDRKCSFYLSVLKDIGVIPYTEKGNIGNKISSDTSNYRLVKKRDIVVNSTNVCIGSVGISRYDGCLSSVMYIILRHKENVYPEYYDYLFKIRTFQKHLRKISNGILEVREYLNKTLFKVELLPVPPLKVQQQIVSFLDTKTSLIDSLVEKTQRKIELLKEKRTSLINEVVTKGLNPNVEMKDSGVVWIGEIPSHWETTRFKYKGEVIIGLSYKPENQVDENEGVLVMRSSNVQNGKPSFHDNVYVDCEIKNRLRTREGDILVCSRNGSRNLIGKNCLITKEIEGMSWGVFMTMYRSPHYKFFYWLLNSPVFKSQTGLFLTSTINQLTVSTLKNMTVPYVDDKIEQQQIVEYLNEKTQIIDKTISIQENRIDLLKEYRQSLIFEVVTGKRKVTN